MACVKCLHFLCTVQSQLDLFWSPFSSPLSLFFLVPIVVVITYNHGVFSGYYSERKSFQIVLLTTRQGRLFPRKEWFFAWHFDAHAMSGLLNVLLLVHIIYWVSELNLCILYLVMYFLVVRCVKFNIYIPN